MVAVIEFMVFTWSYTTDCLQNAKSLTIFEDFVVQGQGQGLVNWFSTILEDKDFRGQRQWFWSLTATATPRLSFSYATRMVRWCLIVCSCTCRSKARFPSKRNRLRWQAANHGCHCFDWASYWTQRTQTSDCVWMETGLNSVRHSTVYSAAGRPCASDCVTIIHIIYI